MCDNTDDIIIRNWQFCQVKGTDSLNLKTRLALPQILTLGFLIIILVGTFLLSLPIASKSGHMTGYINAFFTATSATCVTGMTVVNTALHWSVFGKNCHLDAGGNRWLGIHDLCGSPICFHAPQS
jgi:trk system potassium uptake protein TrkH